MAFLAALLPPLALALAQQAGDPPFRCTLPLDYGAFVLVAGQEQAWESLHERGGARCLVQRFQLDASGARADSVLQSLRQQAWGTASLLVGELSFTAWEGDWGGVPETAGHTVRYRLEGRALAMVERVAVIGDQLVHFLWEGPVESVEVGLAAAASFRVPDAWIPPPPPDRDLHRGVAPKSETLPLPWTLEIQLDFLSRREQGDLEVGVRAHPVASGSEPPTTPEWVLPAGAVDLGSDRDGFRRYRLSGSGDPFQPLLGWGMRYSDQGDLAALDTDRWLAVPRMPPGNWGRPGWLLEALHPGHQSLLGPAGWTQTTELGDQGARTRIGPVPAGRCWPFFLSGRFQKRQTVGVNWHLRLDAKAIVADAAVATLHKLMDAANAWLGVAEVPQWTVVSFPGLGDRALPQIFVLDEQREWFQKPADGRLGSWNRRAWLARLVASSRFGAQLHGSGSAAPVLENALSEWAAARLLDAAGFTAEAKELRAAWDEAELAAGALPRPLSQMPAEEVLASARLLSAGARFWTALEQTVGRETLDRTLRAFLAAGVPWTTQQLERALAAEDPVRAETLRAFFDAHLYGIRKP